MAEGDSPLEITGLSQDTEYPEGMFEATRLENGRESERVDVPYFRTLYFADYEENDVELTLTVDGEETTGTYTILGMPADKYVGGEHDENVVYAVQPDVAESGAVYFLGDEYVDRVVRDGEVVYGRNLVIDGYPVINKKASSKAVSNYVGFLFQNLISGKVVISLNYKMISGDFETFDIRFRDEKGENISSGNKVITIRDERIVEEFNLAKESSRVFIYNSVYNNMIDRECEMSRVQVTFGDIATPYTVAPEDLFPSAQTLPSFSRVAR